MFRKVLSVLLAVSLLMSMMILGTGASASALDERITVREDKSYEIAETKANLDYIIPVGSGNNITYYDQNNNEVDITPEISASSVDESLLPSSYDLRDEGRVTSVKDQGSEGFCWNFATTSSMESSILSNPELRAALGENPQEKLDLSEAGNTWYIHTSIEDKDSFLYGDHMVDDNKGSEGGYHHTIAMGLSSGFGAYPEELMPYESWGINYDEALRFYSDYRLKDYVAFDYDISLAKQRIMEYGTLYLGYTNYSSNYHYTEDGMQTYYTDGFPVNPDDSRLGHAVAVVGWDDNFSKDNFCEEMRPENDGAWLIKNSWGTWAGSTAEGYEGYFWMSYESENDGEFAQYIMQSVDEFDNIYQYQYSYTNAVGVYSAANVFTAKNDEILEQISFSNYTPADLTVEVYRLNDNYTSPEDGSLLTSFTEYIEYSGTHSMDVPESVQLNAGDKFSVVLKSDSRFYILQMLEGAIELSNISFYKVGDLWTDVTDEYHPGYMSIKAYTSNKDGKVYKNELADVIEEVENLDINDDAPQYIKDNISDELQNAKNVFNDSNATQNTVDNTCCFLRKAMNDYKNLFFEINSMDDFIAFYNATADNKYINSTVNLNTDLDFSESDPINPLYKKEYFGGVFNGNGHTISNLVVQSNEACGLFSNLDGAVVSNLTLDNCSFTAGRRAGAISGNVTYSTITGCTITNSEIVTDFRSAGSIAGVAEESSITDCKISGTKIVSINENAGGIVGSSIYSNIENCSISDIEVIGYSAFLFTDSNVSNCVYEDVLIKGLLYIRLDDNVLIFNNSDSYSYYSMLVYENNKLTLHPYIGVITDASSDEANISKSGEIYEIDTNNNEIVDIWVSYGELDTNNFAFEFNILTDEVKLLGYYNGDDETATEIVFPSYIGELAVTSLASDFSIESVAPVKSVVWTENIKMIPAFTFMAMDDLETVTIPDSVTYIGYGAFVECKNIKDVYYGGTEEQWNLLSFGTANESIKNANIHFAQEETTSVTTTPAESTPADTEPESTVTDPAESTPAETEPESTVTDPVESTPAETEPESTVTDPAESTSAETEPESSVTEPVESSTATEATETTAETTVNTEPTQETTTAPQPEFEMGDVNSDGKLNIKDATLIQKHIAKLLTLSDSQLSYADCNMDNKVNIKDATYIQKKIAHII